MTMIADLAAPLFVGREAFLTTLDATLHSERAVAIVGPSGIGKTAVAREYARCYGSQYQQVLWLNATSRELLLADCFDAMEQLHLSLSQNPNLSPIQPLRDWLAEQTDYLLVVNDADDPSLVQSIIASLQGGCVLQVMRPRAKDPLITCLPLEALSDEEGALLVLRQANLIDTSAPHLGRADAHQREAALVLANDVRGLPLALELAGATVKASQCTMQVYLGAYRERAQSLATGTRGNEYANIMAVVVGLACDVIAQQRPQALTMLRVGALLAYEMIPTTLLLQASDEAAYTTSGDAKAVASLDLLLASRLLTPASAAGMVHMHPLVQEALCRQISPTERQQLQEHIMAAIHHQLPTYDALSPASCLRVVIHIQQICDQSEQWTFTAPDVAEVFAWAAMIASKHDNDAAAADLLERALTIWKLSLDDNHLIVIAVAQRLATLYSQVGEYAKEEALWHQVIRARTSIPGADKLEILRCLKNLGIVYMAQDKTVQAARTFHEAITFCEQTLDMDHPLTLEISFQMALLRLAEEQFAEAVTLFTNVSSRYEQTLGPEHEETLASQHLMVPILMQLEQWENAESLLHKLLPLYERTQGRRSTPVIVCLNQLIQLDLVRKQEEHAETFYRQMITIFEEQSTEPASTETFANICTLATVYMHTGRIDDAKQLWKRTLAFCERTPELGLQAKTMVLQGLITTYIQQGKYSLAIATTQYAASLLDEWQTSQEEEEEKELLRAAYQSSIAELRHYAHQGVPVSVS